MKRKKHVLYNDLFNPDRKIAGPNMLPPVKKIAVAKTLDEEERLGDKKVREDYLIEKADRTKCKCYHPSSYDGRCSFRNCRHLITEHPSSNS